jgi:glutamine synthetase
LPQRKRLPCLFLRNKRTEWREYCRHVTAVDLGRYLPVL